MEAEVVQNCTVLLGSSYGLSSHIVVDWIRGGGRGDIWLNGSRNWNATNVTFGFAVAQSPLKLL